MELGGEFYVDLNTLSEKKYSVEAYLSGEQPLYFDSGRSALRYAARSLRPGTILLPEYICDSVITAFSGHTLRLPADALAGDRHGRPSLQAERGSLRRFSDALLRRGTAPGHIEASGGRPPSIRLFHCGGHYPQRIFRAAHHRRSLCLQSAQVVRSAGWRRVIRPRACGPG